MNLSLKRISSELVGGLTLIFNQKNASVLSEGLRDFQKGMTSISNELAKDNERHNKNQAEREAINKKNLRDIWGNKD